jgi:hypothetical protein
MQSGEGSGSGSSAGTGGAGAGAAMAGEGEGEGEATTATAGLAVAPPTGVEGPRWSPDVQPRARITTPAAITAGVGAIVRRVTPSF